MGRWQNWKSATVKSLLGSPCRIRCGSLAREFDTEKGETIRLDHSLK